MFDNATKEVIGKPTPTTLATATHNASRRRDYEGLEEGLKLLHNGYSHYDSISITEVSEIVTEMLLLAGYKILAFGTDSITVSKYITEVIPVPDLAKNFNASRVHYTYRDIERLIRKHISAYFNSKGATPFLLRPAQIWESLMFARDLHTVGMTYGMHMPRTGKTGTSLLALERAFNNSLEDIKCGCKVGAGIATPTRREVLIFTTRNGVKGWEAFIKMMRGAGLLRGMVFEITTVHMVGRTKTLADGTEEEAIPLMKVWDAVILDEPHKVLASACGKNDRSSTWGLVELILKGSPCIFLSATPHAETPNQLWHTTSICFGGKKLWKSVGVESFNDYYTQIGEITIVGTDTCVIEQHKQVRVGGWAKIVKAMGGCMHTLSQYDIGIDDELAPVNKRHLIPLSSYGMEQIVLYQKIMMGEPFKLPHPDAPAGTLIIDFDNRGVIDRRADQWAGGTLKITVFAKDVDGDRDNNVKPTVYDFVLNTVYVDYIKQVWGDTDKMVIMYYYKNEGRLLKKHFKHAKILQGTKWAEAVDLYMFDTMIVYNQMWSASTMLQRMDRQVHLEKRTKPITVHYLCTEHNITQEKYDTVVDKGLDFTSGVYTRNTNLKEIKELVKT